MPTDRPGHTRMALHPETVPWWVTFIAWGYEQVETLDFDGAKVPTRIQQMAEAHFHRDQVIREAAAKGWARAHEDLCRMPRLEGAACLVHRNPFKESSDAE